MVRIPFLSRSDAPAEGRTGIIDIGSNSIRLVVYDGHARNPPILFNEKVMAGLGRGLTQNGALDPAAIERAATALARFAAVARQMQVERLRTVATAAVREASNGAELVARAAALGLEVELLSGEEEAEAAAYGVLAGIPDAEGIVGDLGGGSLELACIVGGQVSERASFPLGVLRVAAIRKGGQQALRRAVRKALGRGKWKGRGAGLPFYLVGGSWRSLALLDMHLTDYPLPIIHQYRMASTAPARLVRVLAQIGKPRLRAVPALSSSRMPNLVDAALLLALLVRELGSRELIVSSYGLREGMLHRDLAPELRRADPLIEAAREEGRRQGRFPEHGDLLDRWIAPLFAEDNAGDARLRHAACLLADIGWRAHPDFRAERGLETALHGNWVGIDARGRAMLGQALYTSFGGETPVPIIEQLISPEERARAIRWGLAMRLGQRLSGGVAAPLETSAIVIERSELCLRLTSGDAALYGEAVERRHKALATALGLRAVVGQAFG